VNELTREQTDTLRALRHVWLNQPLVVIGAVALGCHIPMRWRRTNDLDITVAVGIDRIDDLLGETGWTRPDERLRHRFEGPQGIRVDVLPATPELISAGSVVFPGDERAMSLIGFDLAMTYQETIDLGGGVSVGVATVPVIAILKMSAFLDRPAERERDLEDLVHILDEFLGDDDDRRWESPLLEAGVEFVDQSAFAIGLEVARIARADHLTVVRRFLEAVTEGTYPRDLMSRSTRGLEEERAGRLTGWLRAFDAGLSSGELQVVIA
jgi:predicted nucleotidyltransferase